MRKPAVLLLLALAGCASTGTSGTDRGTAQLPTQVRVQAHDEQGAVTEYNIRRNNLFVADSITGATPVAAWDAVQAVYTDFGIPITRLDAASRTIGAENARVRSRIAGAALSNFLECGTNPTGGSAADNFDVDITVVTSIVPMQDGAVTRTTVNGMAKNRFRNVPPSLCRSTGRLERRIATELKLRLSGAR